MVGAVDIRDLIGVRSSRELCGTHGRGYNKSLVMVTQITSYEVAVTHYEAKHGDEVVLLTHDLKKALHAYIMIGRNI